MVLKERRQKGKQSIWSKSLIFKWRKAERDSEGRYYQMKTVVLSFKTGKPGSTIFLFGILSTLIGTVRGTSNSIRYNKVGDLWCNRNIIVSTSICKLHMEYRVFWYQELSDDIIFSVTSEGSGVQRLIIKIKQYK